MNSKIFSLIPSAFLVAFSINANIYAQTPTSPTTTPSTVSPVPGPATQTSPANPTQMEAESRQQTQNNEFNKGSTPSVIRNSAGTTNPARTTNPTPNTTDTIGTSSSSTSRSRNYNSTGVSFNCNGEATTCDQQFLQQCQSQMTDGECQTKLNQFNTPR